MNVTPFPVLKTEHLILRVLKPEDAPELLALRSDDQVNAYIDRPPTTTLEEAGNFINRILGGVKNNSCFYWAITLSGSAKVIGTICLWNFKAARKLAEVGYELLPEHQGKGLMQEALTEVVGYGFRNLGLEVLLAVTHRQNAASVRLLQRLDFQPDLDQEFEEPENSADLTLYYLKKNLWAARLNPL